MISFILNDQEHRTDKPSGSILLDYIRYERSLKGTKIGCREGDCGACTVLIGKLEDGELVYESMTSCLTPIGNVSGKHVVTVEGLNLNELNKVQQAIVDEGGTQCGFCTVGFVVSLCGFTMAHKSSQATLDDAITAIDGNICRCTGYKSLERAADKIVSELQKIDPNDRLNSLAENGFIPAYFGSIKKKLENLVYSQPLNGSSQFLVGGGTDLFVQKPDEVCEDRPELVFDRPDLKGIRKDGNSIQIGGNTTASELMRSSVLNQLFPKLKEQLKLVSSTPIRNMGTVAGNFVNASPIGDLTAWFLALNSELVLEKPNKTTRRVALSDFYKGYKIIDKEKDEIIRTIEFNWNPTENPSFNFEKISKRTYLDIASVNSAIKISLKENSIDSVHVSAGGVGPTPLYLSRTAAFLMGKELSANLIREAWSVVNEEIAPISDARGSATYKRLALRQLFYAHFTELFTEQITLKQLV